MNTQNLALTSLDLGKNCFHFHGQDSRGQYLFRSKISRSKVFSTSLNYHPAPWPWRPVEALISWLDSQPAVVINPN